MKSGQVNNIKTRRRDFTYVFLVALSSFGFFKPGFIETSSNLYSGVFAILLLPAVPAIVTFINKKKNFPLAFPEKLLLISIVSSILCAKFFWGQSFFQSILATIPPVCGYIFYFYLNVKNTRVETIEKVIQVVSLFFIVFFLISFFIYPVRIFNYLESDERGFQRIFLSGDGFLFLFYFYSLNKFAVTKRKIWLLYLVLAFACVLLNQTRIYIAATTVIGLFYLLNSRKIWIRVGVIVLAIAAFFYISQMVLVKNLQSKTSDQLDQINDYVRLNAADYFLHDFQPSSTTAIFGNGFAYVKSQYGQKISDLTTYQGFYIEDLGFIGLYIHLGILAVLAYLIIFYKALKRKLLPGFAYAKMFLFFLLLTGLTSSNTFNAGFIIPIVFCFYLIDNRSFSRKSYHSSVSNFKLAAG